MPITVYPDVIVSVRTIDGGLRGRVNGKNDRVPVSSGFESINILWEQLLREFDVGFIPMLRASWMQIESLFLVTQAGAYGMLLQDPRDSSVLTGEGVVTALSGTTFQLWKRYTDTASSRYVDRKITRPRALGFIPMISGVAIDPADYSLDTTTGILTIPAGPAAADVTWTATMFYVPVHFQTDQLDWQVVAGGPDDMRYVAGGAVLVEILE